MGSPQMAATLKLSTVLTGVLSLRHAVQVVAQQGRARCSEMTLPHYTAHTPMFMPVGTRGMIHA